MRKAWSLSGTALFLALAPGTIAGFLPWLITRWRIEPPFIGVPETRVAGWLLIAGGLPILLEAFFRFALRGEGTPAPPFPTRKLVVSGTYRYVRNPMYVAVTSLIFGQALVLGSDALLAYGTFVWLAFHLFVVAYEEPTLRRQFPEDYRAFFANVPRWLPRLTPWNP